MAIDRPRQSSFQMLIVAKNVYFGRFLLPHVPMEKLNQGMKRLSAKTLETKDKKDVKTGRRFRNILANSGKEMESGEVRDLDRLHVMSREGKLIKISDLNTDPEKQSEKYSVKFVANHGHNDMATGERVVDIEDIIGDAKVWMESDGLHARVYFANDDQKADHAYAISDNASYSIGTEWYEDGYYGAGEEIDGFVGILREISMVDVGNDPRAYTIDHKPTEAKVQGDADDGNGDQNKSNERKKMTDIKKSDELTPDENRAIKRELNELVDEFTTSAPESQTEPTARESKDEEGEAPAEAPAEKKDVLSPKVLVIRTSDKAVKQERTVEKTVDKKAEVSKAIKAADGKFSAKFNDAISGLADPLNIEQMFTNAIEKSDGIISYFRMANSRGLTNNILAGTTDEGGRAKGFKKGDTKADQDITNTIRTVYCKMVYKKLSLDALELYENPELIQFRAQELVDSIILEIERAAVAGDGRKAPAEGQPDYRMFDGTNRGFFSIKADANAASGYGSYAADLYAMQAGENLYDAVVSARGKLMAGGEQILVSDPELITDALKAKVGDAYLIAPGASIENTFRVARVFAPQWLNGTGEAYLIARNAYTMIGEGQIRSRADFDTNTNQDILLDETPRGGMLTAYKGAVLITSTGASA